MTVCAGIVTVVVCAHAANAKSRPKINDSVFIRFLFLASLYKRQGSGNPPELLGYTSPPCICIFFVEAIA
jgi:hypothetical protein